MYNSSKIAFCRVLGLFLSAVESVRKQTEIGCVCVQIRVAQTRAFAYTKRTCFGYRLTQQICDNRVPKMEERIPKTGKCEANSNAKEIQG